MADSFDRNDRVRHPTFGIGTVVDIQKDDIVEVVFDVGGRRRLSLKYVKLALIPLEEEARLIEESQRLIESTFEDPDAPDAHGHRPHLALITDDVPMFISQVLPTALKESLVVRCWADDHVPLLVFPPEEPRAAPVVWPTQYYGVIMLLRPNEKTEVYECISAYPWFSEGTHHVVLLDRAHPWHSRVEGHLSGTVKGVPLVFFDTLFARHKAYYASGSAYRFSLLGMAVSCDVLETTGFEVRDPEVIRMLRGTTGQEENEPESFKISAGGMVALHHADGADRDAYEFQGPVKTVSETDFLGQKMWQVLVTIAVSPEDGSDIDLVVYVPHKSLKGELVPRRGDDIRGTLWLQGYLVCPEEQG